MCVAVVLHYAINLFIFWELKPAEFVLMSPAGGNKNSCDCRKSIRWFIFNSEVTLLDLKAQIFVAINIFTPRKYSLYTDQA